MLWQHSPITHEYCFAVGNEESTVSLVEIADGYKFIVNPSLILFWSSGSVGANLKDYSAPGE
jgi:hypothetical protein